MSSLAASITLAQKNMVQYGHLSMYILATIGSLINILLFSRRQLRSNSCCLYFLASSVNALILLAIGILPQTYALYNSPNPFTSIQSFCKARTYLNQTSAMSCRWLLVVACIDRCSSCSTNVFIRRFSSVIMARRMIIIIIIFWLLLPIHTIIYSLITSPGNIACSILDTDVALYHRFYTIIMGGALPTIITLLCSLFIWKSLKERRKRRLPLSNNNDINRRKKAQDQQVLFMLIVQIGIFIISTIPFMSFNIYDTMTRTVTNKSADRKSIETFFKSFTELLVYLIAMSFYSNTLVSRTFRKELIIVMKSIIYCGRQKRHRQISPMTMKFTKNDTLDGMMTMKVVRMSMPEVN